MAIATLLAGLPLSANAEWAPRPEVIEHWETEVRPGFNYREDQLPDYELPELLETAAGERICSREAWMEHRPELLDLFREHIYGHRPGPPDDLRFEVLEEDTGAMGGCATLKRVAVTALQQDQAFSFELILFVPNARTAAAPLFLLLNNRDRENTDPSREHRSEFWPAEELIDRGYAIAAIQNQSLAPDTPEAFRTGVIRLFEDPAEPRAANAWGALAAWGWGASRAMDYFETEDAVDAGRVAVLGHSRGGKAALWAGAEDERFAITISNESGCGGAALHRRRFGETLAWINERFPQWFSRNFHAYGGDRKHRLPVDQHQLIALMAPRGVYVASADEDLWTDPRGEFMSVAHASAVYVLWDGDEIDPETMPALEEPLHTRHQGYHIRRGNHDLTLYDWKRYLDFADRFWKQ